MASGIQDTFIRWDREVTSPFTKLTRRVYPGTIRETFAWAEELWLHHGMYKQAISTAVRYFMTELDVDGDDVNFQDRKNYIKAIKDNFDILEELAGIGDDYIAFGNSFTSVYRPFVRTLMCRNEKCSMKAPLMKWEGYFQFTNGEFDGRCPKCGWHGKLLREDQPIPKGEAKPVVTRWPPQFMEIKHHPISKHSIYRLDLSRFKQLRDPIMLGDIMFLNETPWEILMVAVQNQKFEFEKDAIYHMRFPVPAVEQPMLKGWGLPPFMADFETAVLVTMLDKYVETIIVEYLMPFRVFSPPKQVGDNDPLMTLNMGDFVASVMGMIKRHRRNPTDWNFLPYPLEYQVFGGEATDIVPVDILKHFEIRLLHSMGIPPEFYEFSIQETQRSAGPVIGFKMFERVWQHFANQLNKWATWLTNKQGEIMHWEKVRASLKPVSMYEDSEIRQMKMELSAAGKISTDTAFQTIGVNADTERKKLADEQEAEAEDMAERQKKMEDKQTNLQVLQTPAAGTAMAQQQAGVGGPQAVPGGGAVQTPGGAPVSAPPLAPSPGQGMGMGVTLDDLMAQADQIAQQLLITDPTTRRSQLIQLKNQNEALHAQVKSRLTALEQQAKTTGVGMARQGQIPVQ